MCREGEAITAEALAEGLQHLGYRLDPSEVRMLTDRMRRGEQDIIPKSAFLASQLDWAKLLQNHRCGHNNWLCCQACSACTLHHCRKCIRHTDGPMHTAAASEAQTSWHACTATGMSMGIHALSRPGQSGGIMCLPHNT